MLPHLILGLYIAVVVVLTGYGAHMGLLLWLGRRWRLSPGRRATPPAELPRVTVQLPLFNERFVAERGIRAMAALDWPRERLQIQVLDDSTDNTAAIARRVVEELAESGHDIVYLHRRRRDGFKAGALAAGLQTATGELVAMFDADFLPAPDFLRRVIVEHGAFADPTVGFAQARWAYLNRDENLITRAQATMHDPHFFLEQPVRAARGWIMGFNGSGGIWRRSCIEAAGNWTSDTLTEDLDLSYRAFFAGWRATYVGDIEAPNELPDEILAFKRQQSRWARGSIQTARKHLGALWRSPRTTLVMRVLGSVHLLGYSLHPFLLGFVLLWPVCQLMPHWVPGAPALPDWLLWLTPFGLCYPAAMICTQLAQRPFSRRIGVDLLVSTWLGIGLGLSNTVAVLEGFFRADAGVFLRTPKQGADVTPRSRYRVRADWTLAGEILIVVVLAALGLEMWSKGFRLWSVGPFFYGGGYVVIVAMQLREWMAASQTRLAVGKPQTAEN